ncbi:MAG: hypothetical protein IIB58_08070 [Planctomycetes bacterium]|nr:hypothetical protein [Planctomycetota bacterium]
MSALHELHSLDDAIAYLSQEPFGASLISSYQEVPAESLEEPFRTLLVHHDHMTEVLFAYHGRSIDLRVLRQTQTADTYTRFIYLTAHDSEQVVETGVVRINLSLLSGPVRQEITDARKPLGSILMEHDVLRRIEPKWYFRLQSSCPMLDHFGSGVQQAYGRVGLIHCDHQPAIELLEVVADVKV